MRREDCLDRGHGHKDETFVCKKHAARGEFLVCEDIQRERGLNQAAASKLLTLLFEERGGRDLGHLRHLRLCFRAGTQSLGLLQLAWQLMDPIHLGWLLRHYGRAENAWAFALSLPEGGVIVGLHVVQNPMAEVMEALESVGADHSSCAHPPPPTS